METVSVEDAQTKNRGETITCENLRPYGRNVLIERLEQERVTKGGIVLPDNYNENSVYAKLLKVGNGYLKQNEEGDRVIAGSRIPATLAKVGDIVVVRGIEGRPVHAWESRLVLLDGIFIDGIRNPGLVNSTQDVVQSEKATEINKNDQTSAE